MKLMVGLGNPGKRYENTRHNVGFMVIDMLASNIDSRDWSMNGKLHSLLFIVNNSLILAKPTTYMNYSGIAVLSLANYYKILIPDIWVIHDDLDINLGQYKIQKGVGPKLHNGIQSIEEQLKTKDFWRVRVGIDNRPDDNRILGEEYVLEDFNKGEIEIRDRMMVEITKELLNEDAGGM
jgi:PTH1 family peptidyl-tRNA hydrolase